MTLQATLKSLLAERARESLRKGAPDIEIERIALHLAPHPELWSLGLRYHLKQVSAARPAPLILAENTSGLEVEEPRCNLPSGSVLKFRQAGSGAFIFELPRGEEWDGAVIEMRMHWRELDTGATPLGCILLPDYLPRLLIQQKSGPQPLLDIEAPMNRDGNVLPLGGLALHQDAFRGTESLLSAVLVRKSSVRLQGDGNTSLLITGRFLQEMSTLEQERTARLLSRMMEFHADTFGVAPGIQLALCPDESTTTSAGPLLRLRNVRTLGLRAHEEPEDVMLSSRLGSIWWGTGCRITGRHGHELEAAIRGAAGMLWADEMEGVYRTGVISAWENRARHSRLYDRWSGLQDGFRHGLHARMTLSLYQGLRNSRLIRSGLQRLTQESWGQFVPFGTIRAALAEVGVAIPRD